jgi:hypothetical protein
VTGPAPSFSRFLLQTGLWIATGRTLRELGSPPLELSSEERERLVVRAIQEKMAPMVAEFLEHHGYEAGEDLHALRETARILSRILYENLHPVLEELGKRSIDCALLKGGDLALNVYPRTIPRWMDDLDLLVKPPELHAVEEVFKSAGFVQGNFDRNTLLISEISPEERKAAVIGHYEIPPFLKLIRVPELLPYKSTIEKLLQGDIIAVVMEDVYFLLEYDCHFNLSTTFDVRDIWRDLRKIALPDGQPILAQSFSDLLWFLAARMYHELFLHDSRILRQFVDVVALVRHHGHEIDWDRVLAMADRYSLHPSLFYTFWHINEILGPSVPERVLEACNPANGKVGRGHDWGDFLPRMLGEAATVPLLA